MKKLIDIKKKFKLDKFIEILNEKERGSIFDAISKSSNIEIDYYDELHRKPNIGVFFNKVNPNLIYEPLIGIHDSNEDNYFAYEMGLLKINFNQKKNLTFLIKNSDSNAQGNVSWKKCFKENENISDEKLLKIASDELNWDYSSKMPGSEVCLFKKLKWSKDKLKKKFYSSTVKFY
jgi:hypothetical protein|tara:strand:- start:79 stop:606 length:528 start_codon:yes stop_codon:yes gene_type:complete